VRESIGRNKRKKQKTKGGKTKGTKKMEKQRTHSIPKKHEKLEKR